MRLDVLLSIANESEEAFIRFAIGKKYKEVFIKYAKEIVENYVVNNLGFELDNTEIIYFENKYNTEHTCTTNKYYIQDIANNTMLMSKEKFDFYVFLDDSRSMEGNPVQVIQQVICNMFNLPFIVIPFSDIKEYTIKLYPDLFDETGKPRLIANVR